MPRPRRPLDDAARDAADEKLYQAHETDPRPNMLYDADGNRLPLQSGDAALENEWVDLYKAELAKQHGSGGAETPASFPQQDSTSPVLPCARHCIKISLVKHKDLHERPKYWQNAPELPYPYEPFRARITDGPKDAALGGDASVVYRPIPPGSCRIRFHRFYEQIEAQFAKNHFRTQVVPGSPERARKEVWTIEVEVLDRLPVFARRKPVPLAKAPAHFYWDGNENKRPETKSKGAPFRFEQMEVGTTYTVEAPFEGAEEAATKIEVSVEGGSGGVDYAVTGGQLHLTVSKPKLVVKVKFILGFRKVFIVGEGRRFAFAVPLAKKYSYGTHESHEAVRSKALYASKSDKKSRKWVIASQYDVDEPSEQVENLFVYRDPERSRGQFDVTDYHCWHRAADTCGSDCEALLFNNPHPGYGLHMCDVAGVQPGTPVRGRYVSVHSIGSATKVGLSSPEKQAFDRLGPLNREASGQRSWLQGTLGIVRDGSDPVNDFRRNPPHHLSIREVFNPSEPYDPTPQNFKAVATHYDPILETRSLKDLILTCYVEHGASMLRSGGLLCVNGPSDLQEDLERFGFKPHVWSEHKIYYVDYQTNFTSESIHVSWFAITNFADRIREPQLSKAKAFIFTK
jgi:hypothetical protein